MHQVVSADDPCLEYQSEGLCKKCTEGYTLLLYSNTQTICATAADDATTGETICTIDVTQYATEGQEQIDSSIVYKYYPSSNGAPDYCFNCQKYFTRKLQSTDTTSVEMCSNCDLQDISSNFFLQSIYSMSQGCLNCQQNGYKHQVVTALTHLNLNMRECQAPATSQLQSCGLSQYYDTKTKTCLECKDLFPNCAACTSTQCTMCPKGFYLHSSVYDYKTSTSKQQCVFNICPIGYCKNEITNKCETRDATTQSNCQICSVASDSSQVCEVCSPGYILTGTTCTKFTATWEPVFFVQSGAPILSNEYAYDPNSADRGTQIASPYLFIQEAINALKVQQFTNLKDSIKAVIYLGKGDHYFFQCDGDEDQASQTEFANLVKYCDQLGLSLQKIYSVYDNVQITIRPLYCSFGKTLGLDTNQEFKNMCITDSTSKIIVHVNSATNYFNISGSLTFENIKFTGINALAVPTKASNDLSVFPVQLCEVPTEPNGYEKAFSLRKKSSTNSNLFQYTCTDSWYQAPQRPDMTKTNRRCLLNSNQQFKQALESTHICPGEPHSSDFFSLTANNVYGKRRSSLFNIYAFPNYISVYKNPPMLYLYNCDFEYFLGGYESLITVETNNLQKVEKDYTWTSVNDGTVTENKVFYTYNGADKGARIKIANSNFKNSRFFKGMIVYRKPPFIPQRLSFANYTHALSYTGNSDTGSYITIDQSTFTQMNVFTNVTSIAAFGGITPIRTLADAKQLETLTYQGFIHKGIIINVQDFGGQIEVKDSTFNRNMHYIPEASVMPRKSTDTMGVYQFKYSQTVGQDTLSEYKITACNTDTKQDINLFTTGLSIEDDIDSYFDKFERLSVIYISRNRALMYFTGNNFYKNTGTFGGAITINSPNFKRGGKPYLVVIQCLFQNNQAFFGGNAIYVRNTKRKDMQSEVCAGGQIEDTEFTQNIGLKVHNGGAIAAVCEYIDNVQHDDYNSTSSITSMWTALDMLQDLYEPLDSILTGQQTVSVMSFRFTIDTCVFQENYSGLKGTAIYFKQINKMRVVNTRFTGNSPLFSPQEFQLSPHTIYMTNRPISYYDPTDVCLDEFSFLNQCQELTGMTIDLPRTKAALYVEHCQQAFCTNENDYQVLQVNNCEFTANNAGPYIDFTYPSEDTAASIYILGGLYNFIQKTTFNDHAGIHDFYTSNVAPKYGKYFPAVYYQYAHAPVIRVKLNVIQSDESNFLYFRTNLTSCNFTNNKHYQILGSVGDSKQYHGSLLSFETNYVKDTSKYLPSLSISGNFIRDNKFIGNQTSLIYLTNAYVNLTNNSFIGNGYLSLNSSTKVAQSNLPFQGYTLTSAQQYGVMHMKMEQALPTGMYHQFKRNKFSFNYAQQGAAVYFAVEGQYIQFESNDYKSNYALKGPAHQVKTSTTARSTLRYLNETFENQFGWVSGAVTLEPALQDTLAVQMINSTFKNCWASEGGSVYAQQIAALIMNNCTVADTFSMISAPNKTTVAANSFIRTSWSLYDLITPTLMDYLTNNLTKSSGALSLRSTLNTKFINFTSKEQLRSAKSAYLGYSELVDCHFENLTASSATAFDLFNSLLRISYTTSPNSVGQNSRGFRNLQAKSGSAGTVMKVGQGSTLIAENMTVSSCKNEMGSIVGLSGGSKVEMGRVVMEGNTLGQGSVVVIEGDSSLNCSQSTFRNNSNRLGPSVIFSSGNQKNLPLNITNSTFVNNSHDESLITLSYTSTALFANTVFLDNFGSLLTHGFSLVSSNLTLNNITLDYSSLYGLSKLRSSLPVDSGFVYVASRSTLTIANGSQISNLVNAQAVINVNTQSNLYIKGQQTSAVMFQRCESSSGTDGGVLAVKAANEVKIERAWFKENAGGSDIKVIRTKLEVMNSRFTELTGTTATSGSAISGDKAFLLISNTTFEGSQSTELSSFQPQSNGRAINCYCKQLSIANSTFTNLHGLEGGAIYFTSSSDQSLFSLVNSSFINNIGMHGGAIKLQDAKTFKLEGNQFIGNRAQVVDPKSLSSSKLLQKGVGGSIGLDCSNSEMGLEGNCEVVIGAGNAFINNTAEHDGGAIKYQSNMPTVETSVVFQNNSAPYGKDIASYPKELKFQFLKNNDPLNSQKKTRMLQNESDSPSIVSGTPFSFLIYIMDQLGQQYTSDNTSQAEILTQSSKVKISNNQVRAVNGLYNFSDVVVKIEPGHQANLSMKITGLTSFSNQQTQLSDGNNALQISVQARNCSLGEELTDDFRCVQCPSGTYLFSVPSKPVSCKPCPEEATCYGLNVIAPRPGYWRWNSETDQFIQCQNPEACEGGTESNPNGTCAEGYTGIMCGNCMNGYRKSAPFECTKCPQVSVNTLYMLLLLLIALIIVLVIVRANLISEGNKKSQTYSVLLKIIVSHFQILGIIMSINFNWPTELKKIQESYAYFSGISQEIFSLDCFMQGMGFEMEDENGKIFTAKLIFFALTPLIIAAIVALIWAIVSFIKKNLADYKAKTISTTLVIFLLIHPSIARIYFTTFNCITLDGEERHREDISTLCYQGTHMVQVVVLALPAIIIWVFVTPCIVQFILFRNRETFLHIDHQAQLSQHDQNSIKDVRMKYGYFIIGYRNQLMYFWELVSIYRKILLVMLVQFLTVVSSETQVLAGLLCLIISIVLHVKFMPFNKSMLNRMELYSLQVTSLTLYAGMFFVTGKHYQYMNGLGVKWFMFLLVLVPNILFLLHWINQMRIELLKIALQKGKRLFKLLSCGLVNPQEFEKKYVVDESVDIDDVLNNNQITTPNNKQQIRSEKYKTGDDLVEIDDINLKRKSNFRDPASVGKDLKRGGLSNRHQQTKGLKHLDLPVLSSSSESDFKKSLEFEKLDAGGPNFDSSGGGKQIPQTRVGNLKLNLEGIKQDFPMSMMRKIVVDPETDVLSGSHGGGGRNQEENNMAANGARTNRGGEQPATYRKVFPEQVLTYRGNGRGLEDFNNDYGTRMTQNNQDLTDRSRLYQKHGSDEKLQNTDQDDADALNLRYRPSIRPLRGDPSRKDDSSYSKIYMTSGGAFNDQVPDEIRHMGNQVADPLPSRSRRPQPDQDEQFGDIDLSQDSYRSGSDNTDRPVRGHLPPSNLKSQRNNFMKGGVQEGVAIPTTNAFNFTINKRIGNLLKSPSFQKAAAGEIDGSRHQDDMHIDSIVSDQEEDNKEEGKQSQIKKEDNSQQNQTQGSKKQPRRNRSKKFI